MSAQLKEIIEQTEQKFVEIAPKNILYASETSFAIQLLSANPKLKEAAVLNPPSLQKAIINVAAVGLSLNPAKRQAYLITRNIKIKDEKGKDRWQKTVCLEPSYMGLCDLATMSEKIEWIQANVVYAEDREFIDNGPGEKPTHLYDARKKISERGEFQLAYCVAKTAKGDYLTNIMDSDRIYSIRDRSEAWKAGKFGPWKDDFVEMAKKSVVRQGYKMWPKSVMTSHMDEAVNLSNENEGFEAMVTEPHVNGEYTPDQKGYFDSLIENNDELGMYCFYKSFGTDASSESAAVLMSLSNSFPKGKKGFYNNLVSIMKKNGENQFMDIQDMFLTAIREDDPITLDGVKDDLTGEVIKALEDSLNLEEHHAYTQMVAA